MNDQAAGKTGPAKAAPGETASAKFDVIHSDALRFYPELVRDLGGDLALLASALGTEMTVLEGGGALEFRGLVYLLQRTSELLQVPDFGLRLAERQRGGRVMGPIGIVMKNSQTVGQALGYCAKHIHAYSLATRVRFRPDRARHTLLVYLEILLENSMDTRQAVEHALALAHFNITDISGGRSKPHQIWLRHDAQGSLQDYQAIFDCDVLFGQEVDGLVLTEADLLCQVADPDEQVLEMATDYIRARYPLSLPPVHSRVRSLVQRYLGREECTYERVAREMCMHPRTLQRRLRTEDTSFEAIRDDVRRETALRLLVQPGIPLTQIAHQLGYAETSVLSRSCHRWFQATPEQVRRGAMDA